MQAGLHLEIFPRMGKIDKGGPEGVKLCSVLVGLVASVVIRNFSLIRLLTITKTQGGGAEIRGEECPPP